jgi:hypothetical protein
VAVAMAKSMALAKASRGPVVAILKLFLFKSMFFRMNFNSNLSPFEIEKNKHFFEVFAFFAFGSQILPL